MDREVFKKKYEECRKNQVPFNQEEVKSVIYNTVKQNADDGYRRGHQNLIIVMEELFELGQEVSKELRVKGDYYNLLQELADVQLGIYYIQEICGISDEALKAAEIVKNDRVKRVIEKNMPYK